MNGPAALKKLLENQIKVHGPAGETDAVQEEQQRLRLAVNRYAPRGDGREKKEGRERGVTLVFAHANGFHKGACWPSASRTRGSKQLTRCGGRRRDLGTDD